MANQISNQSLNLVVESVPNSTSNIQHQQQQHQQQQQSQSQQLQQQQKRVFMPKVGQKGKILKK